MFSSFSRHRYHGRLKAMALLTLMLATIGHATDYYLTFNDRHLLVFESNSSIRTSPPSMIKSPL